MSKCQYLDVSNCQFSETALKSSSSNKIYNLEALKVVSTELDVSFIQNQSGLASLKALDMKESSLKVPDTVKLANLQNLSLSGNKCIKAGLANLGKGLSRLQNLTLTFSKRQRSDESGFPFITKYLPKESKLEKIYIDLTNDQDSAYAISEIFEEELTQISSRTVVKFDEIMSLL